MENRTVKERKSLVEKDHAVSIRRQTELLEINRSSLYINPLGESKENLDLMTQMDRLYTQDPTLGVLGMQDELLDKGWTVNHKRVRRLLRKMGVEAIYPKRNLSRLGKAKYIHPYLLRHLKVERPNQVWAIDITYIPMVNGFMYLTAVIDVYSRFIVGWQISNSLEKETQTELLTDCFRRYGKPEIINSDQGSQYTSEHWVSFLKENSVQISMDGKGRATDNAFIERFFRTLKQKYVYLYPPKNGSDLYQGTKNFMEYYNNRRHRGIQRNRPSQLYHNAA
ncbi:integrase [Salinimicrobium marinum]|jgi:putative transposase|uniref:Integrase n=1 Tax=Salinimicrobium marinum TaxID=680283 RepID=A0A918SMV1_9FLAO|nr:IS3 family transposase [Salinimicrobium marinum]GHA52347.1 integrase [Salinimicrobium marinum]